MTGRDRTVMEYKGYHAETKYDADSEVFYGVVVGARDVIFFEATSVEELKKEFRFSIDDYIASCEENGERPDEPFLGDISLSVSPDLHRAAAVAASARGQSLNDWNAEAVGIAASDTMITNR